MVEKATALENVAFPLKGGFWHHVGKPDGLAHINLEEAPALRGGVESRLRFSEDRPATHSLGRQRGGGVRLGKGKERLEGSQLGEAANRRVSASSRRSTVLHLGGECQESSRLPKQLAQDPGWRKASRPLRA